jgi:hypothetical protein
MANKRALAAILGAIVVVVISLAVGYWVRTDPETAPMVPPDRQNTEEKLPAAPGSPQQLPGSQK